MAQIHELLPKVALAIGVIEKKQRADKSVGAYPFRGIDDVTAAYQQPFFNNGLTLGAEVKSWEIRDYTRDDGKAYHQAIVVMRYTFTAPDESAVSVEALGASIDYQDKAAGQAMSQALKSALLQAVLSPPGGQDPDARGPYQNSEQTTSVVERASIDEPFCPGCFIEYKARIALTYRHAPPSGPTWRCKAPAEQCGGKTGSGTKLYSWGGWHDRWTTSVIEWAAKAAVDPRRVFEACDQLDEESKASIAEWFVDEADNPVAAGGVADDE